MGRPCQHPLEVCLKFDEMADYLIDRDLGKEITREGAKELVRKSAEIGLVHFVDNAAGKVKHNCNCCGCACWNVGSIRRRKIPRDELMAVYFIRETSPDKCVGCGKCVEICPVEAITLADDVAVVDENWCIGCGVCATRCAFDAFHIKYRDDQEPLLIDFESLHKRIQHESG
jgi:NAD-dependent dihydropyrimidine dehydrogenase PreA subunit